MKTMKEMWGDDRKPVKPRKIEAVLCVIGLILCFVWAVQL